MTVTVDKFYCKSCILTFEGEYKPQQRPRKSCPKCHKMVDLSKTTKPALLKNQGHSSPPRVDDEFIDEPDELVMDIAMKVLNRQRYDLMKKGTIPSNQWASTLITVRKENIGKSTKEGKIRSKFKSMNIKDIAKISSGKPIDISLKPDLEESS